MKSKILILGGTRYLGVEIANILRNQNSEVFTLSKHPDQGNSKYHFVCDRKNTPELEKIIFLLHPDLVIDMICFDKKDAQGICDIFLRHTSFKKIKYIMISTFFVYNYMRDFRECRFIGDLSTINDGYTSRKVEAELIIDNTLREFAISIIRLPYIFSHDDYSHRFQNFVEFALTNQKDSSICLKTSFIEKSDGAKAIVEIALREPYLRYIDLSNFGEVRFSDLIKLVRECCSGIINSGQPVLVNPYYQSNDLVLRSSNYVIERTVLEAFEEEVKEFSSLKETAL